jgi:cell division protein FtsI/penicillin-binding protein 2
MSIHVKANRVLNFILLAFMLILARVWYLAVMHHEEHLQQAHRPQRRSLIEHVERATIRDRFNIPLALNKVQYNVAIRYSEIRTIPAIRWTKEPGTGKSLRVQARVTYISDLAQMLGPLLEMDVTAIEDMIHSRASLFPHIPFVLKRDISETHYYHLKMLEKEWPGLEAQRVSKRFYPQGKVAADVIGYMGSMNQKEHVAITEEIKELKGYIEEREAGAIPLLPKGFDNPLEVRERLKNLQEKAYTMHDFLGKTGIEGALEEELRGFYAKKIYEVDVQGTVLRELPGARTSISGQRVILSISSELQAFAESLLAQQESKEGHLLSPWMKGGAIVAMLPQTGEVVTLASYPRFNPEDFIPTQDRALYAQKQSSILRWLESEAYMAALWDGKLPLEKECFSLKKRTFFEKRLFLTWEDYLHTILSSQSSAQAALSKITDINTSLLLQESIQNLLQESQSLDVPTLIKILYSSDGGLKTPSFKASKRVVDHFLEPIPLIEDKMLVLDLSRLLIDRELFSKPLQEAVGSQTLSSFHAFCQEAANAQAKIYPLVQELFHKIDFKTWREQNFKKFLQIKRREEKEQKIHPRPYLDYLELVEKKMFQEFWNRYRFHLLEIYLLKTARFSSVHDPELNPYVTSLMTLEEEKRERTALRRVLNQLPPELALDYLKTMRSFQELTRPLYGSYRHLRKKEGRQLEKHLAAAFYPLSGYGYCRSQAYRQSTPQGSIFKLVVAYEALKERYLACVQKNQALDQLNPLTLIDDLKWVSEANKTNQVLGFHLDGQPITRLYKGGRLPRSSHASIGKVDLCGAIEQSSNIYFSILAGDIIEDPSLLIESSKLFGFGERTGIELPGEISGLLPQDLSHNRTGLYSFAIGQHSLIVTPLQTALLLSTLANRGEVIKPKIIKLIAGKEPHEETDLLFSATQFPFKKDLSLVGIHFPLFSETQRTLQKPYIARSLKETKRHLFFPQEIQQLLFEGMRRVVSGSRGNARPGALRSLSGNPQALRDYLDLQNQLIGKTGTAEILYKHTLDAETKAAMETHVWFTGISFSSPIDPSFENEPELVVVVYLKFGTGGKEAAPLAAQIVKKWRDICAAHGGTSAQFYHQ